MTRSTARGGATGRTTKILRRSLALAALAGLSALAGVLVAMPAQSASSTTAFTPIADTYVDSSKATTNFGTAPLLQQDAATTSQMVSYLTFTVSGLSAPPTSVLLQVTSEVTGSLPIKVLTVPSTTWSETGITWNDRPATGAQIGQTGTLTPGIATTADVTSAIKADGTYSFALISSATAVRKVDSREAGEPKWPKLLVTGDTTPTTTAPTTTAPTTTAPTTTAPTTTAPTTTAPTTTPPAAADPVIVV
ncbi:MAG: acid phosphatase type 7, partial [Pseudonocardiales bacterium]|nr:acid phosphatase type 7 [Pseudonocardiales bacterium]